MMLRDKLKRQVRGHNFHVTSVVTLYYTMTANQEDAIVCSLWANLSKVLSQKACFEDAIKRRKTRNWVKGFP